MANELRVRALAVGGLVEDNPLTDTATTLTSDALSALPVIDSTNYAAIVIDPDGDVEVAWVTAHTAAASTATIARGKEGTVALRHDQDTPWVHAATLADFPTVRSTEGPNGATRASTTYGALSTPWTVTIPVIEGQVVELTAQVALSCSADQTMYVAFRRASTTIYENTHYTTSPDVRANVVTHIWRDTTPGTGDVTYEIYVASNSGGTVTLRNGATLDTTIELTQGKSIFIARAVVR